MALIAAAAAVAVAFASACIGDDAGSTASSGGDSGSVQTGPDATGGDDASPKPETDAGGDAATCKTCSGSCVSVDDPAYGCTPTSCDPCPALPHVTKQACAGGACAVAACDVAYDDLDDDAGNGCEAANPRAFQASALSLWLKADRGVVVDADGGVTAWKSQNGDAGAGAAPSTGRATVDKTNWPAKAGMPSVAFSSTTFDVDLSGMESSAGYTTFVVSARHGDGVMCVLASHTYPQPFSCCSPSRGQAMQLCYATNTTINGEVFCNNISTPIPANTTTGYQSHLTTMWYDPSVPANYTADNGGAAVSDVGQCPAQLSNLSNARLGGGYSGAPFDGLLGELVVYSALLTPADRAAVAAYLKKKWNTP